MINFYCNWQQKPIEKIGDVFQSVTIYLKDASYGTQNKKSKVLDLKFQRGVQIWENECPWSMYYIVGNKAKGRISKRR